MVRIRLRRNGLKKQVTYRVVAAEKESPRNGRFLEILGSYNPRTEPFTFQVDEERIFHWMKNGAQPSDSVMMLFKSVGLQDRFERYKKGESLEVLMEESKKYYAERTVNTKTREASMKA